MPKKYMLTDSLQRTPFTASSENMPDFKSPVYKRKNIIFSNKTFDVLIFEKKINITEPDFGKCLESRKEHTD